MLDHKVVFCIPDPALESSTPDLNLNMLPIMEGRCTYVGLE